MRTPITLKIKFKSGSLGQFIERYSVDVSRSGIFIRTKEPLAVGTQLKFEFQLQDTSPLIAGEGTVVWTREPDPARTALAPGMGVRFDKLAGTSQQVLDQILSEKQKRGDAAMESRYDAGVRASQSVSGVIGERENTPLPRPMPGLAEAGGGFETEESTRVMRADQADALAAATRADDFSGAGKVETTRVMDAPQVEELAAKTAQNEQRTTQLEAPTAEALIAATRQQEEESAKVEAKPEPKVESKIEVIDATEAKPEPKHDPKPEPRAAEPPRVALPPSPPKRSSPITYVLLLLVLVAGGGVWYVMHGDKTPDKNPTKDDKVAQNPPVEKRAENTVTPPVTPPPVEKPAAPPGVEVEVTSVPAGAQVLVDGKAQDAPTPTKIAALDPKKTYKVELQLKGYKSWSGELHPTAGKPLAAKLVETVKMLEVTSVPTGAEVLLDGKRVGKTAAAPLKVKLGSLAAPHSLEIHHAGFVKDERKITADAAFERKGDLDVLAVAASLVAEEKKPAVAKAVVHKPATKPNKPTEATDKPADKSEPDKTADKASATTEKPADTASDKSDKPEKAPADKPADTEKPADKAETKPEAKPEAKPDKPAADKAAPIKVPSWMKPKPAGGDSTQPPPSSP